MHPNSPRELRFALQAAIGNQGNRMVITARVQARGVLFRHKCVQKLMFCWLRLAS
jgi:hypothetical protein